MMKRVISKRFLSLALAIIMVAALIPGSAFAADDGVVTFDYAVNGDTANATEHDKGTYYWPWEGVEDPTTGNVETATAYLDPNSTHKKDFTTGKWVTFTNNEKTYYIYCMSHSKGTLWPENSKVTIFWIKVPKKGMYQIKQSALNNAKYSGDVAIYIDGQYAGAEYNTVYDSTAANNYSSLETPLNTLYLTPDDNGFVQIAFRPLKYHDGSSARLFPLETVFTPVDSLSIADVEYATASAAIAENDTVELAVGATTDPITAKVKVSDGTAESYRFFHTHNGAQEIDTANGVFVTSSDDTVVSVSDKTIKDADTTFSLTALKPGTATITLTAKVEGTEEDKVETFTVTVPGEATEEPETVSGNVSFGAYSDVDNSVTVTINDEASGNEIESVAVGTTITAVADTTNPNYKFLGWKRGSADNGVWLTTDATVSFPIMTHTFLTAVYEPVANEDTVNVEFYNYNGQYLDTAENVGDKAFSAITKPTASLTGYSNPFWTLDGTAEIATNTIFEKLTRVVANYRNKDSFTVTIGDGITGADTDEYDYDTELNLSAASDGTWYVNEKPVAYGDSYKHCVWDVASITFKAEETTAPIISLDATTKTNGARMISYDANGVNIVEVGILFGSNATPNIGSCDSKATSKAEGDVQGQFTAQPNNGTTATARGYLIYADGETYKVIYAD